MTRIALDMAEVLPPTYCCSTGSDGNVSDRDGLKTLPRKNAITPNGPGPADLDYHLSSCIKGFASLFTSNKKNHRVDISPGPGHAFVTKKHFQLNH